jgi:nucleoid-associated protein EbfC
MSKGSYYPRGPRKKDGSPQAMMKQLQQVQRQMEEAQAALAEEEVEYSAGGGMVKVVIDGQQTFKSVEIDPQVIDPEDKEMLEDLVLAAVTGAIEQSQELAQERMGGLAGGLGLPPGLL